MEAPKHSPLAWGSPASEAPVVDKARIMDKTWEQVQKKTFTKWVNTKLRERDLGIDDLTEDLCDGVMLIHLLEIIGDAEVGRYYKAPKMRIQKMENCNMALAFIKKRGVNLTNIGAEDIVDASEKLILGMIWTIILRFTIADIREEGQNSKDGLLLWCQRRTQSYAPDVNVRDFHTSWNDGLAFCALIHRHRPDLLDFCSLDKQDSHANCSLAFEVAERDLGIAKLLDVEDVVDLPKPDERSLMTYVAQFFHTFSALEKLETAGRRVAKFAEVVQSVYAMQHDYERRARKLMDDMSALQMEWDYSTFDGTYGDAKTQSNAFSEYKKNSKRSWVSEKRELENMLGNIRTKLKTYNLTPYNPPEGFKPADLENAWQRLISREVKRKKDIRAKITEIKQALQDDFSQLANSLAKKLDKITQQNAEIDVDGELEDQLNLYRSALGQVENLESVELVQVIESESRCLEANIEEVEDTVYMADDLAFELAQAKQSLQKKCNFLENQIVARGITNLRPEQLEEFEAAFRHFAKETSNSLTKSEFLSCLQALGVALADEEFEEAFSKYSSNKVFVNFEQFTNYVVSITEDRTSSDQLRSAFQDLATNKVNTLVPTNQHLCLGSQQLSVPVSKGSLATGVPLEVRLVRRSFSDLQATGNSGASTSGGLTQKFQASNLHGEAKDVACDWMLSSQPSGDRKDSQALHAHANDCGAELPRKENTQGRIEVSHSVEPFQTLFALTKLTEEPSEASDVEMIEHIPRWDAPRTECKPSNVKLPASASFRRRAFSDTAFGNSVTIRRTSRSFQEKQHDVSAMCQPLLFSNNALSTAMPLRRTDKSSNASGNRAFVSCRPPCFVDRIFGRSAPVKLRARSLSARGMGSDAFSRPRSFSDGVFAKSPSVRQRANSFSMADSGNVRETFWRISDPRPFGKQKTGKPQAGNCTQPSVQNSKETTKVPNHKQLYKDLDTRRESGIEQAVSIKKLTGKVNASLYQDCQLFPLAVPSRTPPRRAGAFRTPGPDSPPESPPLLTSQGDMSLRPLNEREEALLSYLSFILLATGCVFAVGFWRSLACVGCLATVGAVSHAEQLRGNTSTKATRNE